MARVKVCQLCGEHNPPDEFFCVADGCGTSLAHVSAVDSSEIERMAAEAEAEAAEAEAVESDAVDDGDDKGDAVADSEDAEQKPDADVERRTVRDVQTKPCALKFPWGKVSVPGQLSIGREGGFSPISGQLDAYPTVSRQHAVVVAVQSQWTVRDLDSTNGTYVNGTRLVKGQTSTIQNGDQLGFSRGLQVEVEIAAGG